MSVKTLVTGGAGFIGSHIVDALLERGDTVVVLDDFSTGRKENIAHLEGQIELVEGSIEDLELLKKTMNGVDYVLHQAALPSVPRSIENPIESHNVNANGTLNILLASRDNNVKRVVFASSSSVYGDQDESTPKHEKMNAKPLSPYALGKFTAEEYCRLFYELYGLETVSLRYFNVFGPRQDPKSLYSAVIPLFITAALEGNEAHIFGDGEQSRDFTYVGNNVDANLLALSAPIEKVGGKTFNIATGGSITLLELLDAIEKITGKEINRVFDPPRKGDIKHSSADISAAQSALGYTPSIDFREGLQKTIESYSKD